MNDEFDYLAAFAVIRTLVSGDEPVSQKMSSLIATSEAQYPHVGWAAFRALPFDQELPMLARWLRGKFEGAAGRGLAALWFGLCNPITDAHDVVADFDVCGSTSYDPEDETFGWASAPDCILPGPSARSEVRTDQHCRCERAGGVVVSDRACAVDKVAELAD